MNPSVLPWLTVIAQFIVLGRTTVEEVSGMIAAHRGATDADTQAEDDAALAHLRLVIAQNKHDAQIEAGPSGD
jgi:hypothetical protein